MRLLPFGFAHWISIGCSLWFWFVDFLFCDKWDRVLHLELHPFKTRALVSFLHKTGPGETVTVLPQWARLWEQFITSWRSNHPIVLTVFIILKRERNKVSLTWILCVPGMGVNWNSCPRELERKRDLDKIYVSISNRRVTVPHPGGNFVWTFEH